MVGEELLDLAQVIERVVACHHEEGVGMSPGQYHGEQPHPQTDDDKKRHDAGDKKVTAIQKIQMYHISDLSFMY